MPKLSIDKIIFSPFISRIGLYLGEIISPKYADWVVKQIANKMARRKNNEQVKAVRNNQWIISGKQLSAKELDDQVWQVYYSSAKSLYDYFHCLRKEDRIRELIQFDDNLQYFLRRGKSDKERTLGLVLHMGAFDLSGYAIALQGARPLVLSYPNPNPGYQWHNELRKKAGLSVEPLTMESFQQATKYLRQGGTVITGVDRPWHGGQYQPQFFGHPSAIPVTTIQMAIRTETPVMLLACIRQADENYILHASDLIEMTKHPDRDVELVMNMERVLSFAEKFIRSAPEQWAMFYPVWPQTLSETPYEENK
jgi:KDO2-lipid IV(A) lauroyltransferase